MLSIEQALEKVLAEVVPAGIEEVPLAQSHGRVLADDLVAPIAVPGFDNSAMDGYAVRSSDTETGDCHLAIIEVIPAGKEPERTVTSGTAAAVMTGAPIPAGADSVVILENTDGAQSGSVHIKKELYLPIIFDAPVKMCRWAAR